MVPHIPFYFIRHGQTDWNVEGRMQGHTDIPLNATGLAQAQQAAERLQGIPFTRIITSPLLRALYEGLGGPRLEAKNAIPYHFQPATPAWQLTPL